MTNSQALSPLRKSDYEAIEAAVMETEKGRWFLAEYAQRRRSADTDQVLAAIARLEGMLRRERRPDVDRIRLDIGEMKDAIERTKLEIAQIKSDGQGPLSRFDRASSELDAIVEQTEAATSEILGAAEKVQEIAFTMREAGVDGAFCDEVEALTTTIYMACSFQDLTGQRTQKVVHVLRYLENRINTMIEIWGMDDAEVRSSSRTGGVAKGEDARPDAHLLNGPALAGEGIEQSLIDDLMGEDDAADAAVLETVSVHVRQSNDFERMASLAALDVAGAAPAAGGDGGEVDGALSAAELADSLTFDAIDSTDDDAASAAALADSLDFDSIARDEEEAPAASAAELADSLEFDPIVADDAGEATAEPVVSDEELALAAGAVDTAIEALKEVSGAAGKDKADAGDPFDRMTKTERQALFS